MNTKNLYLTPIIKVVGDYCNNCCGYCFYHNVDQTLKKVMSFELLESFIRQHVELVHGNLSFIWHGGEPLLAGLDFFEEVVRLQKLLIPKNKRIRNSIQTNGTLIGKYRGWQEIVTPFFYLHQISNKALLQVSNQSPFFVANMDRLIFEHVEFSLMQYEH